MLKILPYYIYASQVVFNISDIRLIVLKVFDDTFSIYPDFGMKVALISRNVLSQRQACPIHYTFLGTSFPIPFATLLDNAVWSRQYIWFKGACSFISFAFCQFSLEALLGASSSVFFENSGVIFVVTDLGKCNQRISL